MTMFAILVGMFPKELPESSNVSSNKSPNQGNLTNQNVSDQLKGDF